MSDFNLEGQLSAFLAQERAQAIRFPRRTRRGAQDRKYGRVEGILPEGVQPVAEWATYRRRRFLSQDLIVNLLLGETALLRWIVPGDEAWELTNLQIIASTGLGGLLNLSLNEPDQPQIEIRSVHVYGVVPMPDGSSAASRSIDFIGTQAAPPYFAPKGPLYCSSGSFIEVFMDTPAPGAAAILGRISGNKLPPTETAEVIQGIQVSP